MTPETCPGCGAKLRPDMLACPNCPMSFPEDDGPTRSSNPLKQSKYWQFVGPAVFFGAIGAAIWYLGAGLMHLGLANNQIENGNLFGEKPLTQTPALGKVGAPSGPGGDAAPGAPGAGSAGGPGSEGKPSDEDGMVVISHVDENGTPIARGPHSKGSEFVRPAAIPGGVEVTAPPPRALKEWKLRGTVYDLTTLKPLPGCSILFTDAQTNRAIKTRTDSTGGYRTIVPPLGGGTGYSVTIEKNGYAPNYLDPGTEGVRRMDAAQRKEMARDLAATLTATPATVESVSENPLVTDFFLAPRP